MNQAHYRTVRAFLTGCMCCLIASCGGYRNANSTSRYTGNRAELENRLRAIIEGRPGQVGIAVLYNNQDTLLINNSSDYPMMSMFKLHEAIAVCHALDAQATSTDTLIPIHREELDRETWSPMLQDYMADSFSVSVKELLDYTLVHSDNNTSNLLFQRIVSPTETDRYVRSILPEGDFNISYSEADMKKDIAKSYDNRTSPLSYVCLLNRVFTDSIVSRDKQELIRDAMARCRTGAERIAAGIPDDGNIYFAHRTGSGYTNSRGEIIAVNDGAYVRLPDGKGYAIVVLIKDFGGEENAAERLIAELSAAVYDYITLLNCGLPAAPDD